MKKNEIVTGSCYLAKVSGKLVTVRVDKIRFAVPYAGARTVYDVTNLATNQQIIFRSARRFRGEAAQ